MNHNRFLALSLLALINSSASVDANNKLRGPNSDLNNNRQLEPGQVVEPTSTPPNEFHHPPEPPDENTQAQLDALKAHLAALQADHTALDNEFHTVVPIPGVVQADTVTADVAVFTDKVDDPKLGPTGPGTVQQVASFGPHYEVDPHETSILNILQANRIEAESLVVKPQVTESTGLCMSCIVTSLSDDYIVSRLVSLSLSRSNSHTVP